MDTALHRAERAEERAGTALDGLVMQNLDGRIDPGGFYVYLLWGDDETRPLYVGQSTNIFSRLGSHMSDPKKRYRIQTVSVIRCETERQMGTTELRLIRKYRPELNTAGVSRDVQVH
jgi:predicted GIY-YIG superfamily endonuclease